MHTAVMVLFVLNAVTLVGIVLLQQGKGADAGAAFGSGASATVFGARGSANFLSRFTAILATIFFVLAILLAYIGRDQEAPQSLTERMPLTDYSADPQPQPQPVEDPVSGQAPVPSEVPAAAASSVDDEDQSFPEEAASNEATATPTDGTEENASDTSDEDPDPQG